MRRLPTTLGVFVLGVWAVGAPASLRAQEEPAPTEEGARFLLLPVGAQGVGLARAMTALSTPEGAFWNPAGLAQLGRSRVMLYRGEHLSGDGTSVSFLLAPWPTGAIGISYSLLDSGSQEVTDDTGTVVGSITVRNHQAILSGATRITSWLNGGVNVKWVQFRLGCRGQCPAGAVSETSYATDVGVLVRPLGSSVLQIGMMVAHMGPALRRGDEQESSPLPSRLRLAAAYELRRQIAEEEVAFRVVAEGEDRTRALGDPSFFLGGEVAAGTDDRVYVRGGYVFGSLNETYGAAIGLGLAYERFELSVSRELPRGGPALEQEPVHLSLGVAF